MERTEHLTNEMLRKRFSNQFELVGHAIRLVETMVHSGRAPRIYTEDQNLAVIALDEMNQGHDELESLPGDTLLSDLSIPVPHAPVEAEVAVVVEKKKTRRIL